MVVRISNGVDQKICADVQCLADTWYPTTTRHFFGFLSGLDSVLKVIWRWEAPNIRYCPIIWVSPTFQVKQIFQVTHNFRHTDHDMVCLAFDSKLIWLNTLHKVPRNLRNTKPGPACRTFFFYPTRYWKTQPADICLLLLCYLVLVTFAFIMELQTLHSCGCVIKVANRIILSRSDGQQDILNRGC